MVASILMMKLMSTIMFYGFLEFTITGNDDEIKWQWQWWWYWCQYGINDDESNVNDNHDGHIVMAIIERAKS